jgi:hypothetical protein
LNETGNKIFFLFLLCHFEDAEQAERSHNRDAKRLVGVERGEHHLENTARDDNTIESVERGAEIEPRAERVEFDAHLGEERGQEYDFGVDFF